MRHRQRGCHDRLDHNPPCSDPGLIGLARRAFWTGPALASIGSDMRALVLLLGLTLFSAGACGGNKCIESPGVCPPQLECVGGFRKNGSATCEIGGWVCGRVACSSDAGPDAPPPPP
jgi:hypothetical protein